jgi:hypothetical protein
MDEYQKTFKELKKIIDHTQAAISGFMPVISSDIDSIIKNKEKSSSRIENTLDTLMSMMDFGIGEEEFLRLNKYYATFNKDSAGEYRKYYDEWKKQ